MVSKKCLTEHLHLASKQLDKWYHYNKISYFLVNTILKTAPNWVCVMYTVELPHKNNFGTTYLEQRYFLII